MTGYNHGLTGALIALTVKQPALAIPLSFVSHYAIDFLPHKGFKKEKVLEPEFNRYTTLDFVLSLILIIILGLLFPDKKIIIWTCMIVAAAPDLIWYFYRKTVKVWPKTLDPFTAWHWKVNDVSHRFSAIYDVVWFACLFAPILAIRFL